MTVFEPAIERLSFLDGQTLASRDFIEEQRNGQRFRTLHNRYLHRSWGISVGLHVVINPNRLSALVQPGLAIDSLGNTVILLQAVTVPAPRLTQAQVLALAVTAPGTFEWWSARDLTFGQQVPLGAAFVSNGVISGNLDLSVRRYAQSFAAPRLATGATAAGRTSWQDGPGPATWIEVAIDTGDAGFVGVPQYFAMIQANDPRVCIVSAGPRSFTVRVIGATAQQAEAEAWTVSWVGIENGGSV
jgi:hypothetical protein